MRGEPTAGELQALAARQQQQLDTQARLIAAREQRLRQVYCYRVRLNGGLLIVCNAILKRRRRKKNLSDGESRQFKIVSNSYFHGFNCLEGGLPMETNENEQSYS